MTNQLREMDYHYIELYNRIQVFSLDQSNTQLSFSKRLAKENAWSIEYAQRVIEEYKKFVFLAVVAGYSVSPSDQVDQVWHLHLSYTRSYWQEFCPKVLQTTLHHEPTRGGSSEQLKFDNLYNKTLESYKQFFGHIPPIDIWPKSQDRFGQDLHFIRINTQQNWVLTKPNLKISFKKRLRQVVTFSSLAILSIVVTSCQIISQLPNPINFTGSDFLTFYILTGVMGIVFASWLRFSLRLPDNATNQHHDLSPYEIAFLSGGHNRMIIAAITSLVKQGYVEVKKEETSFFTFKIRQRKLILKRMVENTADPVEKLVAQDILASNGTIEQILKKSTEMGDSLRSRLQLLGLFLNDEQAFKAQIYPSLIMIILLGLGLCKMLVGISRDKPVGFLFVCMWGLLIVGARFFVKPHRSRYGDHVFNDLTARSQDLKTIKSDSRSNSNVALAVALFGATVLTADSALADLHRMLTSSTASYGGDGGGDGGGGGCGGGCGGCGG